MRPRVHVWGSPDEAPESPGDFVCDVGSAWSEPGPPDCGVVYHSFSIIETAPPWNYVCRVCGKSTERLLEQRGIKP